MVSTTTARKDVTGNLGMNYSVVSCEATCVAHANCTAICTIPAPGPPPPAPKPEKPFVDVFGSAAQICTGAMMVTTTKSLLVWGECQVNKNPNDLVIQLRRSPDFGATWEPEITQPFPPPYLTEISYDRVANALVSVGPCPWSHPSPGGGSRPLCSAKSTDEGTTWSPFTPAGQGNGTMGGNEGSGGTALVSAAGRAHPTS